MKNKLLIFLLIIGMVVFLIACEAPKINNPSGEPIKPSSQQANPAAGDEKVYEIGEPGTAEFGLDKFEITVMGAAKDYINTDTAPAKGRKYLYVPIRLKNVSTKNSSFSPRVSLHIMYPDKELAGVIDGGSNLGYGLKGFVSSDIKAGETIDGNLLLYVKESKQDGMLLCYKAKTDGTALLKFKLK